VIMPTADRRLLEFAQESGQYPAALDLAVGALLHVVGAQPAMMGVREVEVGQGVGLGVLQ